MREARGGGAAATSIALLVLPVLLTVTFATPIRAARVDVKSDPTASFGQYVTYKWRTGTPALHEDAEQRVRDAVAAGLASAGLRPAEDAPDLWVRTHILADRQSLAELDDPAYWEFVTGVRTVDAFDVGAGTLVIDLIDARQGKVVWRGAASDEVHGGVKDNFDRIDKAVRKLFKRYPPARP